MQDITKPEPLAITLRMTVTELHALYEASRPGTVYGDLKDLAFEIDTQLENLIEKYPL